MNAIIQHNALSLPNLRAPDHARFFRAERFDALECLAARFRTHRYEPHTHETFSIAMILEGVEVFSAAGVRYAATAGQLAFVNPETVHDGEPSGEEGYTYRTAYPTIGCMIGIVEDLTGRRVGTPSFRQAVVTDPAISATWEQAHRLVEANADQLAIDERMTAALAGMLMHHADLPPIMTVGSESGPIARVKAWLEANLDRNVSLDELAAIANLSKTHLIRAFSRATGLTPHAWLTDRRVRAARDLLRRGHSPVDVAAQCGFYDQAHLNRAFKARIGVTPGAFRGI